MEQTETYILMLSLIVIVGMAFRKSPVPMALLLVMTGMLISFLPRFPRIELQPDIVLNVFFPLMLYQISVFSSWRDFRTNFKPIVLQSIGHVFFIMVLIAVVMHWLIPQLGWAMAFVLGAVISPPDSVAMVAIAKKIHMPRKIVTVLRGEGVFNDATALILFRFSLAVVMTHQFTPVKALSAFVLVVVAETAYGFILGHLVGKLREKMHEPILEMLVSILSPFIAYLPAEQLGGCGVLATVVTGLVIGNTYSQRFSPEVRLLSSSIWSTIGFTVENVLFLLVGLDMHFIFKNIATIPTDHLILYGVVTTLTVIIGRFLWVFPVNYLPRLLFPKPRKAVSYYPWQFPFIISWSGMRGGISLAAALAVPNLPLTADGISPTDLLVFLVFCVIVATLILQGLALPWVLRALGIHVYGQQEKHQEVLAELSARAAMAKAVLLWLKAYKEEVRGDPKLYEEVRARLRTYKSLKRGLRDRIRENQNHTMQDESAMLRESLFIATQIVDVERKTLLKLWRDEKINHAVTNKLLQQLDHRSKYLAD